MGRFECLECTIAGRRLLVSMEGLERVAEFPVTPPPPLAESWVAGLGLPEDRRPLVVVALQGARERSQPSSDSAKALLLRASGSDASFAVLVDDVRAIWSINPDVFVPAGDVGWPVPSTWLTAAQDGDDRVLRLDTSAIARDLFGLARPAEEEVPA